MEKQNKKPLRRVRRKGRKGDNVMTPTDFIAIDFETANPNNCSACSIGLAFVRGLEIVDKIYFLIQPPNNFYDPMHIKYNGITPEMTVNEPQFPKIWEQIKKYFAGENLIVAHNAQFDMSVIFACLDYYEIEKPNFTYIDSMIFCDYLIPQHERKTLDNMAKILNIDNPDYHNALNDAIVCAEVAIAGVNAILSTVNKKAKQFRNLKPQLKIIKEQKDKNSFDHFKNHKARFSELKPTCEIMPGHPVYGRHVVISGYFDNYTAIEIWQKLLNLGAIIKPDKITADTVFLINGKQDPRWVNPSGISKKQQEAEKRGIRIIGEKEFESFISEVTEYEFSLSG